MTYREYATMDRLMQGITPAPVEYIAEELGGEKFKTVCDDIYAVLKGKRAFSRTSRGNA